MKTRKSARLRKGQQGRLAFASGHGGRRKGAGRKRGPGRRRQEHRPRRRFRGARRGGAALHVTLRIEDEVSKLRRWSIFAAFVEILSRIERADFRIIEFSLQDGHVHLIVEARDWEVLSSAIRGLEIRLARRINAMARRHGRVIADRYHVRVLSSPTDARRAIVYVLQNAAKHARSLGGLEIDPLSSASWFGGWRESRARAVAQEAVARALARTGLPPLEPVRAPQTGLLTVGWKKLGATISVGERPRS